MVKGVFNAFPVASQLLAASWLQRFAQERKGCLKESGEENGQIKALWAASPAGDPAGNVRSVGSALIKTTFLVILAV